MTTDSHTSISLEQLPDSVAELSVAPSLIEAGVTRHEADFDVGLGKSCTALGVANVR